MNFFLIGRVMWIFLINLMVEKEFENSIFFKFEEDVFYLVV